MAIAIKKEAILLKKEIKDKVLPPKKEWQNSLNDKQFSEI